MSISSSLSSSDSDSSVKLFPFFHLSTRELKKLNEPYRHLIEKET